jgi:hypothetical protein
MLERLRNIAQALYRIPPRRNAVSDVVEVRLAASEIANEVERGAETRRPSPALTR